MKSNFFYFLFFVLGPGFLLYLLLFPANPVLGKIVLADLDKPFEFSTYLKKGHEYEFKLLGWLKDEKSDPVYGELKLEVQSSGSTIRDIPRHKNGLQYLVAKEDGIHRLRGQKLGWFPYRPRYDEIAEAQFQYKQVSPEFWNWILLGLIPISSILFVVLSIRKLWILFSRRRKIAEHLQ